MQVKISFILVIGLIHASYGRLINQHDQLIREIILQHEEAMQHAPRIQPTLKHDLPVPAMIVREGYPVETHTVITEDCYILEMHRIPHGKDEDGTEEVQRPAVYLQHGLLCSSADWVMGSSDNSLGFLLADAGYDVWLGNYRGNTYSRGHCSLQPKERAFWQFSWDEMGKYDIPAMIDKVLDVSKQNKTFYIGHSMGTTGFMVMANDRPEYQDKIVMASLLAPVAFVDHMKSPIRYLAPYSNSIAWIANFLGGGEFLPSNFIMDILSDIACDNVVLQELCSSILFVLCGFDEAQLNKTMVETIVHHTPAGTSTNTVIHYAQEIKSKKFAHFDHGKQGNLDAYNQEEPPEYSIEAIKVPVAAYWSQNDWLAQPEDVLRLLSKLQSAMAIYEVPFEQWNHLDYLWGIDAKTLLYPEVMKNMESMRQKLVN